VVTRCVLAAESPLTFAAHLDGVAELLQVLSSGGAHLDFRARDGMTALHKAARSQNQAALAVSVMPYGLTNQGPASCLSTSCLLPVCLLPVYFPSVYFQHVYFSCMSTSCQYTLFVYFLSVYFLPVYFLSVYFLSEEFLNIHYQQ